MVEGHALVKATLRFAHEQPVRSWWCLLSTTVLFAGCLAVAAIGWLPWWVRLTAGVLGGLVLCRLFIIYHDQQHGTILRGSRVADWLMTGFGILTLNPPSTWNSSHNYHHKHNGKIRTASIGSFPVMTVENYKKAGRWERFVYGMSRHWVTILLAWVTVFLVGMTVVSLVKKPREHLDCAVALVVHVTIWVLLIMFASWTTVALSFVLPLAIGGALGAYLFYVQHNFPEVDLGDQSEWDYVFAALKSSSFLDTTRLMHWFTGNIGYHHIHHLNARIPFYRLPEAMKAMPELQRPGRTKLNPVAVYKCCRLKLWDAERGVMVGYNGR